MSSSGLCLNPPSSSLVAITHVPNTGSFFPLNVEVLCPVHMVSPMTTKSRNRCFVSISFRKSIPFAARSDDDAASARAPAFQTSRGELGMLGCGAMATAAQTGEAQQAGANTKGKWAKGCNTRAEIHALPSPNLLLFHRTPKTDAMLCDLPPCTTPHLS